jgi:hypothetical protein
LFTQRLLIIRNASLLLNFRSDELPQVVIESAAPFVLLLPGSVRHVLVESFLYVPTPIVGLAPP